LTNSEINGVIPENMIAGEKAVLRKAYGKAYLDWEIDESARNNPTKRID